jgi:plastocyanin
MKRCNGCARLAIVLASLGTAAPVGTPRALANDPVVHISNFAFSPQNVTVAVGATVTFRNDDDMIHSIVAPDGSFRSKALDTGDEFSFTFSRPGEFAFVCGLHPFMHGKVTVTP